MHITIKEREPVPTSALTLSGTDGAGDDFYNPKAQPVTCLPSFHTFLGVQGLTNECASPPSGQQSLYEVI